MPWTRLEGAVYWITVVSVFLAVAIWESLAPNRKLTNPAERRWSNHGILLAISFVLGSVSLRLSPVAAAVLAAGNPYGLFRNVRLPFAVICLLTILVLDLLQYAMHWTLHRVPVLWRIHEVHHSDPDFDVSTAARFHPLEVLGTQAVAAGVIGLLAPPTLAVLIAEVAKLSLNLVEHANASLPAWLEGLLRRVIVTPDLHRIHHAEDIADQSHNLGQIFPWWDRLFGTYTARAAAGGAFGTGLRGLQNSRSLGIGFMLAEPFRKTPDLELPSAARAQHDQSSGD